MLRPHHKQVAEQDLDSKACESRIQMLNLICKMKEFDNLEKIIAVKISRIFIAWNYFEFLMTA